MYTIAFCFVIPSGRYFSNQHFLRGSHTKNGYIQIPFRSPSVKAIIARLSLFQFHPGSTFQVSGYKFQVPGYKFQVTGYKFQVRGYKFQIPCYKFQVTSFRFQVTSSRFQVTSSRFQVPHFNAPLRLLAFTASDIKQQLTALKCYCAHCPRVVCFERQFGVDKVLLPDQLLSM